jgi:hypothetical protein
LGKHAHCGTLCAQRIVFQLMSARFDANLASARA